MKRVGFILLLLLMVFSLLNESSAATYYVNATATGDNSGSDWANAFTSPPQVLGRGDTYYIAGGAYSSYTFDDPLASGEPQFIYIKKATQEDHGIDTGWESSFGTESAVFAAPFVFKTGYYEIDGQVGGGPGSWDSGHGIKIQQTAQINFANIIRIPANVSNLVFKHIEMSYTPCPQCTGGQDVIYSVYGGSNWTFQYCYMHHPSRVILLTHGPLTSNILIEKSMLERNGVSSYLHSEIWSARDTNNVTIRHSMIVDHVSTGGIIISRGENWDIYGNIFIWTQNWGSRSMDGAIGSLDSSPTYLVRNVNIYNNTFVNLAGGGAGKIFPIYMQIENIKAYNNLWYNSLATAFGSGVEHNYNWFMNSNDSRIFESAMQIGTEDPFVNSSNYDFHLRIPTNPGLMLPEPYNVDMDGVRRGLDGTWDRGAFELDATVINNPPVAADDSATTTKDTPVAINVLMNDTDAEGDALAVMNLSAPANGIAFLNPGQTVTYTPNAGFKGTDSFTYNVTDGKSNSNTATVTVTVAEGATLQANYDSYSTNEDTPLEIASPGVLSNDILSGTNPRAEFIVGPVYGNITLNADGSFIYSPTANYNGPDSFTYRIVNDNGLTSAPATVSLTINPVNDPPMANDDTASTFTGVPVLINMLSNDIDIESDILSVTDVVGPQNGSVTINADNSVTYTPAPGFFGMDSFTYRPFDGTAQGNAATVSVTVNLRLEAVNDTYATNEDAPLQVASPGVLGNDAIIAGVTALLVTNVTRGSLALNPDGSFLYTPGPNYAGTDSFTYKAVSGGVESNIATVTITVRQTNSAPVANQDSATTPFNTAITIPVLANDTDPDGDVLSVAAITAQPANGTATVNPDGTVTYNPNAGFSGTDKFYYAATDGTVTSNTARVTVSVRANRLPVAVIDYATTSVNTPVTIDVAANDYDIDGTIVRNSVTVITAPGRGGRVVNNNDGTVTFTPAKGFVGSDYFFYNIKDDYGATSKSAKVTVKAVR